MKQEEFDKKVNVLIEKVDGLGPKLDSESGEIAGIVAGYKAEIQRLKDSQGDNIDMSRLDALNDQLEGVGTRIGGLVDPLPVGGEQPGETEPATPAETIDEEPAQPEAPATSVETEETETTVTTKTEDAEGNKEEEEVTTATETAEAVVESDSSENKDEE